ncbi:MAG TPA: NAD(P)/FAD-dependent oxidoreductase [Clostridia bacterium]|nr:NAD(P)/FAD-dependent oxidoreductase [Clostridia bacterium]
MERYDVIVIGGCASGLCAAIQAARTNTDYAIAVLERMPRVGKKILATGNGRCNLSNAHTSAHPYHNADFAKHALEKYSLEKTLSFFKSLGLLTVQDSEGRLYPMSNTATSVLDVLRFETEKLGIDLLCSTTVKDIKVLEDGRFVVDCTQTSGTAGKTDAEKPVNVQYLADKVIFATGGKASPAQGSDGSGYPLLKRLGHSITPLFPALVQLNTANTYTKQLKGIRVNANISVEVNGKNKASAKGEILFTEYGLSGIATMEVSRAASEYFSGDKKGACSAVLDLAPHLSKEELTVFLTEFISINSELEADKLLIGILPSRVGQIVFKSSQLYDFTMPVGSLKKEQLDKLIQTIKAFRLDITGTRGFNQAQVTAGGIDVHEFNSSNLMSAKTDNLYACGELLDVDGGCGGFNLQWAWSSGLLAGELG